jgi:hypothetical protein
MKSNSKQAATTGTLITAPPITTSASVSPVAFQRGLQAFGVLLAVLELQRVDRQHLLADLVAAFGVEERVEPRARADAVVVVALRADVEVLLQVGLVEHRLARRALDPQPSGTVRRSVGSVCWILGGSSFSSQLMGALLSVRPGRRGSRP